MVKFSTGVVGNTIVDDLGNFIMNLVDNDSGSGSDNDDVALSSPLPADPSLASPRGAPRRIYGETPAVLLIRPKMMGCNRGEDAPFYLFIDGL
jgi:hypothetical protein